MHNHFEYLQLYEFKSKNGYVPCVLVQMERLFIFNSSRMKELEKKKKLILISLSLSLSLILLSPLSRVAICLLKAQISHFVAFLILFKVYFGNTQLKLTIFYKKSLFN